MVLIKSSHIFLGLSLFASLLSVKADLAGDVCALVNKARAKAGCKPVTLNQHLMNVAKKHNQYCVNNHILTHDDPAGTLGDRFKQCGYEFSQCGENVAEGFSDDDAAGVMNAWMNSPGHRANILNPAFCDMGCVCKGGFCTQDFGTPLHPGSDSAPVDNSDDSNNSDDSDKTKKVIKHIKHVQSDDSDNNDGSDNNDDSDNVKAPSHHGHPHHGKPSDDSNNDDSDNNDSDNGPSDDSEPSGESPDDSDIPVETDDDMPQKPGYKTVPFGKKPCPKKQ